MSRLWDTPEFWARSEVDDLLRDFPNTEVVALTASFERSHPSYVSDPAFARDIIAELTKRSEAGIRFWPEAAGLVALEREVALMLSGTVSSAELEEEEDLAPGYWWKKM